MRPATIFRFTNYGSTFAALAAVAAVGCASTPEPTERLVGAEAALRAAEEVGASRYPQAEYHAQLAREQLQRARKLLSDGDNERAGLVLQRATADAEVAVAITREGAAKQSVGAASGKPE